VVHAEILAPEGSAPWLTHRARLWNYVEAIEKRQDAQLAREINIALPHEPADAQRFQLVRTFVAEQFIARGMVADIAIHRPVSENGDHQDNRHAHILLTLRHATRDGLRAVKTRQLNSKDQVLAWRAAWADYQNAALRDHGHRAAVDHRSLKARQTEAMNRGDRASAHVFDRLPEIHVGPKARQASRAGRVVIGAMYEILLVASDG